MNYVLITITNEIKMMNIESIRYFGQNIQKIRIKEEKRLFNSLFFIHWQINYKILNFHEELNLVFILLTFIRLSYSFSLYFVNRFSILFTAQPNKITTKLSL